MSKIEKIGVDESELDLLVLGLDGLLKNESALANLSFGGLVDFMGPAGSPFESEKKFKEIFETKLEEAKREIRDKNETIRLLQAKLITLKQRKRSQGDASDLDLNEHMELN